MAKKKKKKNVAKRQAKASKRKVQKRKLRLVRAKNKQQVHNQDDYNHLPPGFDYPPLEYDQETPSGFRAIGMSEAVMEFAKAMIKHPDIKGLSSMEDAMNLAMPLWNYTIAQEQGEAEDTLRSEIIKALMPACKLNRDEAGEMVDKVVARKNEMFPPEVQPQGTPYMFMRKEVLHLITPFDYDRFSLNAEVLPVTAKDRQFLKLIAVLDETKEAGADYEEWEGLCEPMFENCRETFDAWLVKKIIFAKGDSVDFGFYAKFFINFIYNYGCTDILRNTDYGCFDEFFYDFVLRKIMMEPGEHVEWVPALRLFFTFLAEKGYVEDATPFVEAINGFEEPFLSLLRKEYG